MSNDSNETQGAPNVVRLTDHTALFLVDYHIWSGRKKLRAEDLQMGTALPPDALISLGSKKICNPDALRVRRHEKMSEKWCKIGASYRDSDPYRRRRYVCA